MKHIKMSYFCFFTYPEFTRCKSGELCPSLYKERGEDTVRWLVMSELKYHKKYFSCLSVFARNKLSFYFHFCTGNNFVNNAGVEQCRSITKVGGIAFADFSENAPHDFP